jgi:hypothetical protein
MAASTALAVVDDLLLQSTHPQFALCYTGGRGEPAQFLSGEAPRRVGAAQVFPPAFGSRPEDGHLAVLLRPGDESEQSDEGHAV